MATRRNASPRRKSPAAARPASSRRLLTALAATLLLAAWERFGQPLLTPGTSSSRPAVTALAPRAPAPLPEHGAPARPPEASGLAEGPRAQEVARARALESAAPATRPHAEDAPAHASEDALALPHTHGRRVDHLARARVLREDGDLSGALTECRRALHDDALDEEALLTAARLARLTGHTELAARAYGRLGQLRSSEAGPLVQQARLLLSLGRWQDAIHVGEEAVLRDPEEPEAYQVLGRAHLAADRLDAAILRFQQAVHLHPQHGHALNNLGFAYLRAGQDARAAEVLTRAAALLPQVAYVHNNLGVACERLGRLEEARAAYATATLLSPRYAQARLNAERLGRVALSAVHPPASGAGASLPEGEQ